MRTAKHMGGPLGLDDRFYTVCVLATDQGAAGGHAHVHLNCAAQPSPLCCSNEGLCSRGPTALVPHCSVGVSAQSGPLTLARGIHVLTWRSHTEEVLVWDFGAASPKRTAAPLLVCSYRSLALGKVRHHVTRTFRMPCRGQTERNRTAPPRPNQPAPTCHLGSTRDTWHS